MNKKTKKMVYMGIGLAALIGLAWWKKDLIMSLVSKGVSAPEKLNLGY